MSENSAFLRRSGRPPFVRPTSADTQAEMLGSMVLVFALYLADGKGLAMTDEVQRGGYAQA
jgi:hypothetical protein